MQDSPILIHVPHASVFIPPRERRFFIPPDLDDELLKMTDRCCDELFDCGKELLVFPVSRLVCDVERFADDASEPMAAKGMGLAYTRCADGSPLRSVSPQKRASLKRTYYEPHHERLTELVNEKLRAFGKCVIIDGHSFSAVPLPYEEDTARPDFCVGTDPFHTPPELTQLCVSFLRGHGYTVSVDRPFSGTIVPSEHYRRDGRVISVMIEISRRLYMTPDGGKNAAFPEIKHVIRELVDAIGRA